MRRLVFGLAALLILSLMGCRSSRNQELLIGTWVGSSSQPPRLLQVRTDGNLTELSPMPGGVHFEDFQYRWRSGQLWLEGYRKEEGPISVEVSDDRLTLTFPMSPTRDAPEKVEFTRTTAFDSAIRSRGLPRLWRPSPVLAAVLGDAPIPLNQALTQFWKYVRDNALMDGKTELVRADARLKALLGRDEVPAKEVDRLLEAALIREPDPLLEEENALFAEPRAPGLALATVIGSEARPAPELLRRLEAHLRAHGRAGTPWKLDSKLEALLATGSYRVDDLALIVLEQSQARTARPEAEQRIRKRLRSWARGFEPDRELELTDKDLEKEAERAAEGR